MSTERSLHTLEAYAGAGLLTEITPELQQVAALFSVSITPAMTQLIDRSSDSDPIAAQFVPTVHENTILAEERSDPIGDEAFSPVPGIVHRYPDRVLLKLLHTCPVYCRFCFRREKVGSKSEGASGESLNREEIEVALGYIQKHPEIWEVILTGGDPLMLSDRRLSEVIASLNAIPHVKIIRVHTRIPVVQPERVTSKLVDALRQGKPVYVLLHCNHAKELTQEARAACARLVEAGIVMLSQSVLLRGVNDDAETLRDLMRALVESRVKPHYIHHADLAKGTSHFSLPIEEGQALIKRLRGHISGLCQPTYILDIPGGYGKVPIGPVYTLTNDDGRQVEDYNGGTHRYDGDKRSARP